jgi:hypothetical protein
VPPAKAVAEVFRYDGKSFTVFRNKDGKAFNNVWSIIEDKKGNIWTTGAVNPPDMMVWALSRYDQKSLNNKKPTVTEIMSGGPAFLGLLEASGPISCHMASPRKNI